MVATILTCSTAGMILTCSMAGMVLACCMEDMDHCLLRMHKVG